MSLERHLTRDVTIRRMKAKDAVGATRDVYGDPVRGQEATVATKGWLEQTESREIQQDRQTVISDHLLLLKSSEAIDGGDQVLIDGKTYEVVGSPADPRTHRGIHHLEVNLRLIEE